MTGRCCRAELVQLSGESHSPPYVVAQIVTGHQCLLCSQTITDCQKAISLSVQVFLQYLC